MGSDVWTLNCGVRIRTQEDRLVLNIVVAASTAFCPKKVQAVSKVNCVTSSGKPCSWENFAMISEKRMVQGIHNSRLTLSLNQHLHSPDLSSPNVH
jgi:hypothetical protein